jgi:competence protein ComEC
MSRAGLVATLSLLAWYYGRKFHPFVLLPFAAAITVAWQPSYVWGDLGWQLSFSAFMAVILLAPLLQRYFFGDKPPATIRQILGETVAAHLATMPIIASSFSVLSHVAIPANLLIVPLVPLAMLLTFLSGLLGLIAPMTAEFFSQPTTWLLGYMTSMAEYVASLPWAQATIEFTWWAVLLYYAALGALMVYLTRRTKLDLREANIVV